MSSITPELEPASPPTAIGSPSPIRSRRQDGVLVLGPDGVLDDDGIVELDQILRTSDDVAIIDLGDCVLGSSDVLDRIDPTRWNRTRRQVCVVCRRFSGRRLLARTGVTTRIGVFPTVGEAVRALAPTAPTGRPHTD